MHDPVWFWKTEFTDGRTMTFYADNKGLALDHAETVARDLGTRVVGVMRLGHVTHLSAEDAARAGTVYPKES